MRVNLAYGRNGLEVDLPDTRTTVIEPEFVPGLPSEVESIRRALREPCGAPPLWSLGNPGRRIAISVCDATRAIPTERILPVLLDELGHVPPELITILIATGTHRSTRREELARMLGTELLARYRVLDHDCTDESHLCFLGRTDDGIPVWISREWVESDIRISVGFVEPHFFAGFSGGPKMVVPGLAGLDTILGLHSARLIGDPKSIWGEIAGNPLHRAIREVARRAPTTFAVDVTINRLREITRVFAGKLASVHRQACDFARETAMRLVAAPFDIVVTSNSGYPLDLNLYQSVKGMSAAARVVKPGGTIICASECSDGIPEHGEYGRLLSQCREPKEVLERLHQPGFCCRDQWQAQIQAQVQLKAEVLIKSSGLRPEEVRQALLEPIESIEEAVEERLGRLGDSATICVLPEGPQTIPYL